MSSSIPRRERHARGEGQANWCTQVKGQSLGWKGSCSGQGIAGVTSTVHEDQPECPSSWTDAYGPRAAWLGVSANGSPVCGRVETNSLIESPVQFFGYPSGT
jgi:hypothetical protein